MRAWPLGPALLAAAGQALAAPAVESITWLVSNTMAVQDGDTLRRPADELTAWLQVRLPGVQLKPTLANAERSWALIRRGGQVCHAGAARTPERERLAYFSNTWLVPPPHVIVRQDRREALPLDSHGAVDLEALMRGGTLRGIVAQGRSYGAELDAMLAAAPPGRQPQHVYGSDYGSSLLAMLVQDRADYTLDYPNTVVALAGEAVDTVQLAVLPVKGAAEPVISGVACPRTAWGLAAIRLIDQALGTPEGAALLRDTLRISLPPEVQRAYREAWDAFFRQRARPTAGL